MTKRSVSPLLLVALSRFESYFDRTAVEIDLNRIYLVDRIEITISYG
jgi:hypothetical protein